MAIVTSKGLNPSSLCASGSEDGHQTALFCWARQRVQSGWYSNELACMFAIPNGGHRNPATAARMKATGVKPGVPDIMLPVERRGLNGGLGLFIELKRPATKFVGRRRGTTSDEQDAFHELLRCQGYRVDVCYGWQEAVHVICAWLVRGNRMLTFSSDGYMTPFDNDIESVHSH